MQLEKTDESCKSIQIKQFVWTTCHDGRCGALSFGKERQKAMKPFALIEPSALISALTR